MGLRIIYLARSAHSDAPGAPQSATGDRRGPAWFCGGADGAPQPRPHDLRRRRTPAVGSDCHLCRRPHPPVQLRREQIEEVRRWLGNYHKLKEAIEEICELNHALLRPDDATPRQTRTKRG